MYHLEMLKTTKLDMKSVGQSVLDEHVELLLKGYSLPTLANGRVKEINVETLVSAFTQKERKEVA
jgi:hypothetical protein